ncbi:hypothetical protein GDO81_002934 [Engystomops pustulosus]|uniref:Uncharacterized protein n=1 Tax=Engystomops pustulosus TaxID=76066 RepID=A0AAV7DPV1_ENGPU|nr:hypothetical protein GDO81_002934 [Engystomops pustulosus]
MILYGLLEAKIPERRTSCSPKGRRKYAWMDIYMISPGEKLIYCAGGGCHGRESCACGGRKLRPGLTQRSCGCLQAIAPLISFTSAAMTGKHDPAGRLGFPDKGLCRLGLRLTGVFNLEKQKHFMEGFFSCSSFCILYV